MVFEERVELIYRRSRQVRVMRGTIRTRRVMNRRRGTLVQAVIVSFLLSSLFIYPSSCQLDLDSNDYSNGDLITKEDSSYIEKEAGQAGESKETEAVINEQQQENDQVSVSRCKFQDDNCRLSIKEETSSIKDVRVCASNGRFYPSICDLKLDACLNNTTIQQKRAKFCLRRLRHDLNGSSNKLIENETVELFKNLRSRPKVNILELNKRCDLVEYEDFKSMLINEFDYDIKRLFEYLDENQDDLIEANELWPHNLKSENNNNNNELNVWIDRSSECKNGQFKCWRYLRYAFEPRYPDRGNPCSLSHLMLLELRPPLVRFDLVNFEQIFSRPNVLDQNIRLQSSSNRQRQTSESQQRTISLRLGDDLLIKCRKMPSIKSNSSSLQESDESTMEAGNECWWTRLDVNLASIQDPHLSLDTNTNELTISDAQLYLSGEYKCFCKDKNGDGIEETAEQAAYLIQVLAEPRVQVEPKSQWSTVNSRVSFECQYDFVDTRIGTTNSGIDTLDDAQMRKIPTVKHQKQSNTLEAVGRNRVVKRSTIGGAAQFGLELIWTFQGDEDDDGENEDENDEEKEGNGANEDSITNKLEANEIGLTSSSLVTTTDERYSLSMQSSRLTIDGLRRNDSGWHICQVRLPIGDGQIVNVGQEFDNAETAPLSRLVGEAKSRLLVADTSQVGSDREQSLAGSVASIAVEGLGSSIESIDERKQQQQQQRQLQLLRGREEANDLSASGDGFGVKINIKNGKRDEEEEEEGEKWLNFWMFHDNGISVYRVREDEGQEMELLKEINGHSLVSAQVDGNWNQLTLCGGLNPEQVVICEWSDNAVFIKVPSSYDRKISLREHGEYMKMKNIEENNVDDENDEDVNDDQEEETEDEESQGEREGYRKPRMLLIKDNAKGFKRKRFGMGQSRDKKSGDISSFVYVGQPNLNRLLVLDAKEFEIVAIINTEPQPRKLHLYKPNKLHLSKWIRRRLSPSVNGRLLGLTTQKLENQMRKQQQRHRGKRKEREQEETVSNINEIDESSSKEAMIREQKIEARIGTHSSMASIKREMEKGRARKDSGSFRAIDALQFDIWLLCYGQPLVVDPTGSDALSADPNLSAFERNFLSRREPTNNYRGMENFTRDRIEPFTPRLPSTKNPDWPFAWPFGLSSSGQDKESRLRNRKSVYIVQTTFLNRNKMRSPHSSVHRHYESGTKASNFSLLDPVTKFKRSTVITTHHVSTGTYSDLQRRRTMNDPRIAQEITPFRPIDLIQDLSVPGKPYSLIENPRHKLHFAYVSHYNERRLFRVSMDDYRYDREIDLQNCDPIQVTQTAQGLLVVQCRAPISHQLTGQLVLDELTSAHIEFNANVRAQDAYLSPDNRYLISVYTNQSASSQTLGSSTSTQTNGQKDNSNTIIYVQSVTALGLKFQYEIKTSTLDISQCSFVWRDGYYAAIFVSTDRRDQESEILSLRLADGRLELMARIPGIVGAHQRHKQQLLVAPEIRLAALSTSEGTFVVDLEENRVFQSLRHRQSPPTLLWV